MQIYYKGLEAQRFEV